MSFIEECIRTKIDFLNDMSRMCKKNDKECNTNAFVNSILDNSNMMSGMITYDRKFKRITKSPENEKEEQIQSMNRFITETAYSVCVAQYGMQIIEKNNY
jgi:hypothetical protein